MRPSRLATVVLLALWACDSPVAHSPTGRASLSLELAADRAGAAVPDQYRIHLQGPSPTVRTGRPGESVVLDDLLPGTYTVALEGLVSSAVETYGERTGVSVTAGQDTNVTVILQSFIPDLLTLPTFVEQGGTLDVRFMAVQGASTYVVEWDDDPGFTTPQSAETSATSLGIQIDVAGIYFVRVSAVNRLGTVGKASSGESVNVVDSRSDVDAQAVTAPATAAIGGAIPVSVTTHNGGRQETGPFRVGLYLSTNPTITTDDPLLDSCAMASLSVGATTECARTVKVPDWVTPGTYYVGAIADDQEAIDETNENNNARAAANPTIASIEQPDLVVTRVTAPSAASPGAAISVSTTTRNGGAASATGFRVGVYLSANGVITTDDLLLGMCAVTSLDASSDMLCDLTATLPLTLTPGDYFVGAVADDLGEVVESDEANNSRAAAVATVVSPARTIDLEVVEVTAPDAASVGGTIDVTSRTTNPGSTSATDFRIGLYLSEDPAITPADVLLGSCFVSSLDPAASFVCGASVVIPGATAPGLYYVGAFADDQGAVDESDESNNALAAAGGTTVVALPDLTVAEVSAPTTAAAGGSIQVDAKIDNVGHAPTGSFRTTIFLSDDATISSADVALTSCSVDGLDPGASASCSASVTIPASTAPGVYFVGALADDQAEVDESDEANNTGTAPANTAVGGIVDLAAFGVTASAAGTAGGKLTITSRTANQGTLDAGGFRVGLYLSPDAAITTSDVLVGQCDVSALAAGATQACDRDVSIPTTLPAGTYWAGAVADFDNRIDETSETNNDARAANPTDIAAPTTDLVVSGVTAPPTGTVGAGISVTSSTDNVGGWDAGAFRIGLYLSTDVNIDASDVLLDSCSVALLPAGGSTACDRNVTIPGTAAPGTYYVGAFADDQSAVLEVNEANNVLAATNPTVLVGPADLTMTSVTAPTSGVTGGTLDITSTVLNPSGTGAGSFLVGLYLSADATITTGDVLVGSCLVASLSAGATAPCDLTVTVPLALPPGTYWVGAVADTQDDVAESNEGNNALAAFSATNITATPADLTVIDVTASASVPPGGTISIRITGINQGGTATAPFRIGVYLSTDTTITGSDILLGACFNVVLGPGQTVTCSNPAFPVTGVAPGSYFVGAIVDDTDVVVESDELNNALAASSPTVIN